MGKMIRRGTCRNRRQMIAAAAAAATSAAIDKLENRTLLAFTATLVDDGMGVLTATFTGDASGDTISITVDGGNLRHNRFSAGDANFASDLDFDTTQAGEQQLPNLNTHELIINADAGNDTIDIGDGADVPVTISAGDGDDTLNILDGNVAANGDAGTDTVNISATSGNDAINISNTGVLAGAGAAVLYLTTEVLNIDGLGGTDAVTFTGSAGSEDFVVSGLTATAANVTGLGTPTSLTNTESPLTINGGAGGTDTLSISGTAGDDAITVSATSVSGLGQSVNYTNIDTLSLDGLAGSDSVTVSGTAGNDSLTISTTAVSGLATPVSTTSVEGLFLDTGDGDDNVEISAGTSITGTVAAGAGSDTLDYSGFTANVTVNLATGAAAGTGGISGFENITGGAGDDSLTGVDGTASTILGLGGNDTLIGANQPDSLVGGEGNDSISGLAGNDTLDGDSGSDTLVGGTGNDSVTGGAASGATLIGLSGSNLVKFNSATPNTFNASIAITGLGGTSLIGIDFRPATSTLYGLGANGQLFQINPSTGAATAVGAGGISLTGTSFGFDFNPVPDRIRLTSDQDQNLRLNPDTGALAATDGTLAYSAGDANEAANPNVVASAYTNSFAGTTATTLYNIDSNLDILAIQNPPNNGTLVTVGGLGVDATAVVGFDIQPVSGLALATLTVGGVDGLYSIDLSTGAATLIGALAGALDGLAITPDNDLMIWNNGDNTDTMDGGAGRDEVEVNGHDSNGDDFTIADGGANRTAFNRTNLVPFALDIGTTEVLDVNGGGGNDTISVDSGLDVLTDVSVSGDAGDDTLNIEASTSTIITAEGGDGTDALNVDANAAGVTSNATSITVAGNAVINFNTVESQSISNAASVAASITGTAGNDAIVVTFTTADSGSYTISGGSPVLFADATTLSISAGGGDDTISFVNSSGGAITTTISVDGGAGTDSVSTSGSSGDDTIAVSATAVTGSSVDFTFTTSETIAVDAGDGNDTLTINEAGALTVTFQAGAGTDSVTVNGGASADTLNVDGANFTGEESVSVNGLGGDDDITLSNIATPTTVSGGDGSDDLIASGTSGVDAIGISATTVTGLGSSVSVAETESLAINALDGDDVVTVSGITIPVTLDGGAGDDELFIEGSDGVETFTVNATSVAGLGGTVDFLDTEDLTITAADGDDSFSVTASPDTAYNLVGNEGTDSLILDAQNEAVAQVNSVITVAANAAITFSAESLSLLNATSNQVTVNGTAGNDTIIVTFTGADSGTFTLNGVTAPFTGSSDLAVTSGAGADTITITNASGAALTTEVNVNAGDGNDSLTSDNSLDLVYEGGTGTDDLTINGTAGDDSITVTDTTVVRSGITVTRSNVERLIVNGLAGNDTIDGSTTTGANNYDGGDGNDTITGGSSDDSLLGGAGNDSLVGNAGNDTITGGDGVDSISSGEGNDVAAATFTSGADTVVISGTTITVNGEVFDLDDNLTINALAGDDVITVNAHTGTPTITGGDGNDTITVNGSAGNDAFTFSVSGQNIAVAATGQALVAGGFEDFIADGGDGNDSFTVAPIITGLDLRGGNGNDAFNLTAGDANSVTGGAGTNTLTVTGTSANDVFNVARTSVTAAGETVSLSGIATLTLRGLAGNDRFKVGRSDAALRIIGDDGNDTLTATSASATRISFNGGAGSDRITFAGTGNADNITISRKRVSASRAILFNAVERININGGNGNDVINGVNANVALSLFGGAGGDRLTAGLQKDRLLGQGGVDRIFADNNDTADVGADGGRITRDFRG